MGTAVHLDAELVNKAKASGKAFGRSMAKQIEYWTRIGRIAEANPELTGEKIREILLKEAEDNEKAQKPTKSAKIK